jgi:hypothetical protein
VQYLTLTLLCCFRWSYSILREEDALPTATQWATDKSSTVPLAVGLTLGLLALATLGAFGLSRRRRRRSTDSDAHPASMGTISGTTQVDQQLDWPRYRKHSVQPIYPPCAPMITGDSTMSSVITELGPPPSYESPLYDGRVGMVEGISLRHTIEQPPQNLLPSFSGVSPGCLPPTYWRHPWEGEGDDAG